MKVVGIVGIIDLPKGEDALWRNLRHAFQDAFPGSEFVVEKMHYLPWQRKKMRALAQRVLEKHDTGDKLILLGYSMGGVIACAVAERFVRSRVRAVVTIGAPHRTGLFYRMVGEERRKLPAPVFTFYGLLDLFVPKYMSAYPGGIQIRLWSDHLLYFLLSNRPARAIARAVQERLLAPER